MRIRSLNIEATTVCSANCRFCPRTYFTKRAAGVPAKILDLERFFSLDFENTEVVKFVFCGSFGEPTFHPDFLTIMRFARVHQKYIIIHTNGAIRPPEWWKELGNILQYDSRNYVTFGLDGINDETHRPYRGTDFRIVRRNIEAFVEGGGIAKTQLFVFSHNQHCLDEYKDLVINRLGCKEAIIRASRDYDKVLDKPKNFDVKTKQENIDDEEPMFCFPEDKYEVAIDTDAKIHVCCYFYIHNFIYKYIGEKELYKPYRTFEEFQRNPTVKYKIFKELDFCKQKCRGFKNTFLE